jgi:hypothetical protein
MLHGLDIYDDMRSSRSYLESFSRSFSFHSLTATPTSRRLLPTIMLLDMSSGDSILAILIGLLGAFLLHVVSRLMEVSVPFHVSAG